MAIKSKYYFLLIILCIDLFVSSLNAQETNKSTEISKLSYAEKIYLQLSNTVFTTGETIWFKTIVTNTINQPSKRSGVLYVDLIDFDDTINYTKKLKL